MSLWQHYDKVITRMHLDICRLIEEKAEIEACVEALIAIRDQAHAVHATGAGTYNDKRTSVDRKKLSDLGLMVKESYKTIPTDALAAAAEEAKQQIEYLHGKFQETGTGNAVIARLESALAAYRGEK